MLDRPRIERIDRVAALVAAILAKHGVTQTIGAEDELATLGLTSIDMVELMLGVEAEFDLTIPPKDISLENFRSIAAIDGMIATLQAR